MRIEIQRKSTAKISPNDLAENISKEVHGVIVAAFTEGKSRDYGTLLLTTDEKGYDVQQLGHVISSYGYSQVLSETRLPPRLGRPVYSEPLRISAADERVSKLRSIRDSLVKKIDDFSRRREADQSIEDLAKRRQGQ